MVLRTTYGELVTEAKSVASCGQCGDLCVKGMEVELTRKGASVNYFCQIACLFAFVREERRVEK